MAPASGGTVTSITPGEPQTVEGGIKESTDIVSKDKGGRESKVTVDVTKDLTGNVISSGAAITPTQKPGGIHSRSQRRKTASAYGNLTVGKCH